MRRLLFFSFLFLCHCQSCAGICGNCVLEDGEAPVDASSDASDALDGMDATDADAGPCDPMNDFDLPTAIAELDTASNENAAVLTDDEKEIFYLSDATQSPRVFHARRDDASLPFGKGAQVMELKSNTGLTGLALSPDGLTLYIVVPTYNGMQVVKREILFTRRADRASTFGPVQAVSGINDPTFFPFEIGVGSITEDMYLSAQRLGSQTTGLWVSSKSDAGYDVPTPIFDASDYHSPAISSNELSLYFAHKPGIAQSADTFRVQRSMSTWGAETKVNGLSQAFIGEFPNWFSKDNCRAYLSVNDGVNGWDLYIANRKR